MPDDKPYRLPTAVIPDRYELRLSPDLTRWTFTGQEKVSVTITEPVRDIILNAAELELHRVALKLGDGKVLEGRAFLDGENERAKLSFAEALPSGRAELLI